MSKVVYKMHNPSWSYTIGVREAKRSLRRATNIHRWQDTATHTVWRYIYVCLRGLTLSWTRVST